MNILLPTVLGELSRFGRPMFAEDPKTRAICSDLARLKWVRARPIFRSSEKRIRVSYQITAAGRKAARS